MCLHQYQLINPQSPSLAETLRLWAPMLDEGKSVPILLMSPRRCKFGLLAADGTVTCHKGESIDLTPVFDARAFSSSAELRWLKGIHQPHRTIVLAAEQLKMPIGDDFVHVKDLSATKSKLTYLLWGQGTGNSTSTNWSTLATAQIGQLHVPLANVGDKQYVCLNTQEYLREDNFGNVTVVEERLINLEIVA